MPKIVIYSRISTQDKHQDIYNQELAIVTAGWKVDAVYKEMGVSGTVPPMQRPEFSRMMKSLPRGSKVVVTAQDRLTRSTKDLLIFIDEIKDLGIELYILQYPNVDCASSLGIMILTIAASISAMELANLKYRINMGLQKAVNNKVIFGKTESVNPQQMREIYDLSKEGIPHSQIASAYSISTKSVQRYLKKYNSEKALQEYENHYNRKLEQHAKAKEK